jgi:acyl carrier protein
MKERRQAIMASIKASLPFGSDPHCNIDAGTVLADLGVNSLHVITLLLSLQQEYSWDVDQMERLEMPTTVGDLVRLVEDAP